MGNKKKSARQAAAGEALVYLNSAQFTCRAVNISAKELLLIPSVSAPIGTYLRMNVSLPGFEELLDVDGLITDITMVEG